MNDMYIRDMLQGWPPVYVFGPDQGDRVRIRKGYDEAGRIFEFHGKSNSSASKVIVIDREEQRLGRKGIHTVLAAAVEPYPYTREERIERAIEDFEVLAGITVDAFRPELFAILDAGV